MSPRTTVQFEKIRMEKRKLIMDVAMEIFADKTYQGASISMIAEKAGISKGLLYNYFESKEALLKEIIQGANYEVWQFFDPNKDGVLTKEEFLFFISKSLHVVKENINYWKLYSALLLQPVVLDLVKNDFDDVAALYSKLIYNLFNTSNLKDPEGELLLMSAMLKGAIIQYVAMPALFPIDKFETAIINYYTEKFKN